MGTVQKKGKWFCWTGRSPVKTGAKEQVNKRLVSGV